MRHLLSFTLATLMVINAMAQERMPRCLHSLDNSLIQPAATHDGMLRAMSTSTSDGLGQYGKSANGAVKSIGAPVIPIIMVEFTDLQFNALTTPEKVTRLFNENGYHDDNINMRGSVRDYFIDNSNGLFAPSFEVVGKVTLSNNVEYYGQNDGNNKNKNIRPLVAEAVELAQASGVDFGKYVDNGSVPMVIIYYAGQGENTSRDDDRAKYIWPHFSNYTFDSDGIRFASYFAGNEWRKSVSSNGTVTEALDGIGVLIHEFGHALGLPDLYPTNGYYYQTPDWWSVMDYGEYYANGYRPVGMTAYERSYLGWLDVKELAEASAVTLSAGEAAVVRNPANTNEYYLLENRQDGTWYPANNYGSGLLVMHIDYLSNAWAQNTLNNTADHLRCHVVCADGEWTGIALADMTGGEKSFAWNDLKTDLFGYGDDPVTELTDWMPYTAATMQPVYDIEVMRDDDNLPTTDMRFSYVTRGLATTITAFAGDGSTDAIYTLDGRRVAQPTHGIYIIGGRKIMINDK